MSRSPRTQAIVTLVSGKRKYTAGQIRRYLGTALSISPFDVHLSPIDSPREQRVFFVRIAGDETPAQTLSEARLPFVYSPIPCDVSDKEVQRAAQLLPLALLRFDLALNLALPIPVRIGRPLFIAGTIGGGSTSLDTLTLEEWQVYRFSGDAERRQAYRLFNFGQSWLADVSLALGWPVYEGSADVLSTVLGEAIVR